MCNKSHQLINITIRRATLQEATLLAELGARTFEQAFGALTPPADLAAYLAQSFAVERLSVELADARSTFLIAYNQGEPAGYAKLYADQPPECVTNRPAIELVRLYALKQYWGQGIGAALMQQCLNLARQQEYTVIWLSSWKLNERANAFYHRWQFTEVGEKTFAVGTDIQEDFILARSLGVT